jgi:putative transcriptional regulator
MLDTCSHVKYACHVKNRVRELRSAKGMSQGELGNVLGVSRQTINSIENERYMPSLPLALAIARCFEQSVERIFTVDEEES